LRWERGWTAAVLREETALGLDNKTLCWIGGMIGTQAVQKYHNNKENWWKRRDNTEETTKNPKKETSGR